MCLGVRFANFPTSDTLIPSVVDKNVTFKNLDFLPGGCVDFSNVTVLGLEGREFGRRQRVSEKEMMGEILTTDDVPRTAVSFCIEKKRIYTFDCTVSWFDEHGNNGHYKLSASSTITSEGKVIVRPLTDDQVIQKSEDITGCSCSLQILGNQRVALICQGLSGKTLNWGFSIQPRGLGQCMSIQYAFT